MLCNRGPAHAGYARRSVDGMHTGLRAKLGGHMDAQTMQDIANVEASGMPETAKKQGARRRQAMYILTRRRISLDAMSRPTGACLTAHVLAERRSFVIGLRLLLRARSTQRHSTSFSTTVGGRAPGWLLASRTVCIPKGDYHTDAQAVVRKAGDLRLITLVTTLAKTLARHADKALTSVASSCVAAPQRGFVDGRSIDESSYELEGAFVEYSILGRDAAMLPACPSLHRIFMLPYLSESAFLHLWFNLFLLSTRTS